MGKLALLLAIPCCSSPPRQLNLGETPAIQALSGQPKGHEVGTIFVRTELRTGA